MLVWGTQLPIVATATDDSAYQGSEASAQSRPPRAFPSHVIAEPREPKLPLLRPLLCTAFHTIQLHPHILAGAFAPLQTQLIYSRNDPTHTRIPSGARLGPLAPLPVHRAVDDGVAARPRCRPRCRCRGQQGRREGAATRGFYQALLRVHDREPHRLPRRRLLQGEAAQDRVQGGECALAWSSYVCPVGQR